MNNYEKIKSMTIEEMANILFVDTCHNCILYDTSFCLQTYDDCIETIKQWLESEEK